MVDHALEFSITRDDETINLFFEMFPSDTKLELIYRGSKDFFNVATYHQKCDKKGAHVTILKFKNKNKIFGA